MNPLAKRPWLLVVLAFVVLIAAWATICVIAARNPMERLTPDKEVELLRSRAARTP